MYCSQVEQIAGDRLQGTGKAVGIASTLWFEATSLSDVSVTKGMIDIWLDGDRCSWRGIAEIRIEE